MTKLHDMLAIVLRKLLHRLKESHPSMTMNNDKAAELHDNYLKKDQHSFHLRYLILYISFAIFDSIRFFQNLYISNRCTLVYHAIEKKTKVKIVDVEKEMKIQSF